MTDNEILKKAIEKAMKGGFDTENMTATINSDNEYDWDNIIFSHSFAKAFWKGHKPVCKLKRSISTTDSFEDHFLQGWQFHLQQLVLSEDRLKYIERILK